MELMPITRIGNIRSPDFYAVSSVNSKNKSVVSMREKRSANFLDLLFFGVVIGAGLLLINKKMKKYFPEDKKENDDE